MRTQGDKTLEDRFEQAFATLREYEESDLAIKASFGLITFRGTVSSKALRLEIVGAALGVMDEVLGKGHQRIAPNPR